MKFKLILSFAIILIVPAVIVGVFSYSTARMLLNDEMLNGFKQTVNVLNSSIDNTIQPKIHDMNVYSKSITSKDYKVEEQS